VVSRLTLVGRFTLKSMLLANRGEVTRRIIRTAKRLGVKTIAMYSDVDETALFAQEADRAIRVSGSKPRDSYLNIDNIIGIAKDVETSAVHPGYDLLSERRGFALTAVVGGQAATARNLAHLASLVPPGIAWEEIGISQDQWLLVASALALGGNVRAELEDNFYLSPGVIGEGNWPLVEKVMRMSRDIGQEAATVEEARAILGVREMGPS
jgi:hypothetical protein